MIIFLSHPRRKVYHRNDEVHHAACPTLYLGISTFWDTPWHCLERAFTRKSCLLHFNAFLGHPDRLTELPGHGLSTDRRAVPMKQRCWYGVLDIRDSERFGMALRLNGTKLAIQFQAQWRI